MAFCKNCGAELPEGVNFCPACGADVKDEAKTENEKAKTEPNGWEKFCSTENDITAEVDPADAKDNVMFGVLAYLFWLCLIPLLARKQSKYCQFHAKQGMFLAVLQSAASVIFTVLSWIPFAGPVFGIIGNLFGLAYVFFTVVGLYNVATGKTRELPIIGKFNFFK